MADNLDLPLIEKDLTQKGMERCGPMEWLRESCDEPAAFWKRLLGTNGTFFTIPGKSRYDVKYDFYHDILARNHLNPGPAFRWFHETDGWQEIGYRRLEESAALVAARWESRGAAPGRILCIVSHVNERFLVSLLAALKIGLIVSILPPLGPVFLRRRIDALAPDLIWTSEEHVPLLTAYRSILIAESVSGKVEAPDSRSHSYAGSMPVAFCFDPSDATPDVPRALNAETAYLSAVRDGAIALGLRPGTALAAPGFDVMATQPALLLACLLNGATYVHVKETDVVRNPGLLATRPLRAVGVTSAMREVLVRNPVEIGKTWDSWFRDPAESQDIRAWTEFIEVLKLNDAFAFNLRWNASLGGCILFSVRRKGVAHVHVLPAAGVPWFLADPVDRKRESLSGCGWLTVRPPGTEQDGIIAGGMLAADRNEWVCLRPVFAGRYGKFYPASEVLDVVSDVPRVWGCSVVDVPISGADGSSKFALLAFVGGRQVNGAIICENLRKKIAKELGEEFLPDAVEVLPLHPRRGEDGNTDHDWCGREYLSGGLSRRVRGEVYRSVTELRDLIHSSGQGNFSVGR